MPGAHEPDSEAAAGGAIVAEVAWRDADGHVNWAARTPLVLDGQPCLALTYDDIGLARRLATAPDVVLVISDARRALRGWEPLAVPVAPSVSYDPEGETFLAELVEQELRKYPPSRLRADSLLQRRENWWYVARVLVTLRPTRPARPIAARHDADSGVLAWVTEGGLAVDTVSVDDWSGDGLRLASLGGAAPHRGAPARAAVQRHDHTADLEQRATLVVAGHLDGTTLWPTHRHGDAQLPGAPSVWRRVRRAWAFERACRRQIRAAAH